jgi:hypothetical protein
MKYSGYLLFLMLNFCVSRPTESDVLCKLSYDVPTNTLTTSIVSNLNDVYMSSGSYLKIYKIDSLGHYSDWTQNFYSLSLILALDDTVFQQMNDESISKEKEILKKELIKKINPVDSIEYETLEEQFEIKMHTTIPLVKMKIQKAVISLSPLSQEKGCYKFVFVYQPKDFISLRDEKYQLPDRLGEFKRLSKTFRSNELYICF